MNGAEPGGLLLLWNSKDRTDFSTFDAATKNIVEALNTIGLTMVFSGAADDLEHQTLWQVRRRWPNERDEEWSPYELTPKTIQDFICRLTNFDRAYLIKEVHDAYLAVLDAAKKLEEVRKANKLALQAEFEKSQATRLANKAKRTEAKIKKLRNKGKK